YNRFVVNDTVTGYQMSDVTSIDTPVECDVVVAEKYYNLKGVEVHADDLPAGLYIRWTKYGDGRVVTRKYIKR
ncbi:MAG: hypothetical protein IKW61_05620, partial [Bacteroidaceae bacterium]|nr:hypothetical protein [Bacteroidaceae bacterium]